jgi:hypothetical protein
MNRLFEIDKSVFKLEEIENILKESTIFDKIEFSGISKETIKNKIHDLETRQTPNRTVLLNMPDKEVTEYWFKNWLHPQLKHSVKKAPIDKRGCSKKVLENDIKRDFLHFYENGQQNFNYTLNDIKQWLNRKEN